jgi:K+-sensing histidine kinase KdpD
MALVGAWAGLGQALAAAVLSFLLCDYFLIPPVGSFTIDGQGTLVTLLMFLATAGVAGLLASQRRQVPL